MKINTKFWIQLSIFNLIIVAALGVLMRYKIGFAFPYFEQKYIQHAHSHFAFAAWISQTIMVFMIGFLQDTINGKHSPYYKTILIVNLVSAYGMLFSFFTQGYGVFSIAFSQISIINTYLFAFLFYRDLKQLSNNPATPWFKAALLFNIISSIGTYSLAFMMINHQVHQNVYLASVYYYLHFQYNGWFFFACVGLLIYKLHKTIPGFNLNKKIFYAFFFTCFPAYLLSTLWLNLPIWIYVIVVVSAIVQMIAWIYLLKYVYLTILKDKQGIPNYCKKLFILLSISVSIKFLLQLGSTIPFVSVLAFGFRPIIIAYLHLVLLAMITLFLLIYLHAFVQSNTSRFNQFSVYVFIAGIFLNEIVLTVQGVASFSYNIIPYANELLFLIAVWMFLGLIMLIVSQRKINWNAP